MELATPRGATLDAILDLPDGPGPHPVVVLAPGRNHHMRRTLPAALASRLAASGIATLRFDWAYTTAGDEPHPDLDTELEDCLAAVAAARALPELSHVALAGKSMGTVVAWRAQGVEPARAVVLLTPLARDSELIGRAYPGLDVTTAPVFVIGGKADPLAAALGALAMSSARSVTVAITAGDHGFCEERRDDAYVPEAVELTAHWLRHVLSE